MTLHYGVYEEEKHPLAVHIWGHRLRTGQHWIEYMLEFLAVLAGFDYRLGQGLPAPDGQKPKYKIPARLGLRRFVFYDEREKTRDARDTRAVLELRRELRTLLPETNGHGDEDLIEQVRSLLRSFSAIEEERSWYAKSLFPVNEQFLLWEALRKGAAQGKTPRKGKGQGKSLHSADELPLEELDRGVEFLARNFFARGGELYYLIISAGTEGRPELRERIGERLRTLLTKRNQTLGRIAQAIDKTWTGLTGDENEISSTVGWIPDPDCALYRQIADDLANFLDNELDSLECLELLAHLIGFHIVTYIYHRAHPASDPEGHASGSCLEACRPVILVDLLGEQEGGVVREQSAALLREQDDLQLRQARALVEQKVREWAARESDPERLGAIIEEEAKEFFLIGQTKAKSKYDQALRGARARAMEDREVAIQAYTDAIFEALSTEFRKNFLGVHRKIGRAIGLIAPRKGPSIRFVLGDTLLKTLTLAMLRPKTETEQAFGDFLEELYRRYGIVVGAGEARDAGLLARLRINEEYYAHNRDALRERMQRAGLLTQFSDATALVRRP